jgi:ATP-dependent protease ClpP protease subunit
MPEETTKQEEKQPEETKAVSPVAGGEKPKEKELSPIQKLLQKSDVLLMLYPKDADGNFSESIQPKDEIEVYKLIREQKKSKESLVVLLDTSGGNVYSAVKIMDTLRTKYKNITIAIPQEAKSSGTMMCCGADKLIMGPISELGPLDKPMIHPDNETARISALDIVKSIDGMLDTAEEREKELAKEINDEFGVPVRKSLTLASDSISKLISPMLCREDVKIYNQAKRLLAIAENYGKEFLTNFMLKYIDKEKLRERIADMIIRRLVWLYPDHGFAIRRNELKDWFFLVDDAEKVDFWDELWKEFEQNIGARRGKVIRFLN